MKTNDIGRLFWCQIPLTDDAPLIHVAPMHQARWPYLQGRTLILRFRHGHGLIVGIWSKPDPKLQEEQLLLKALRGRPIGSYAAMKKPPLRATNVHTAELTLEREEAEAILRLQERKDVAEAKRARV